jgi:hypothetical protein
MLSPDHYVHAGLGAGGFNRYAYAGNNPLKYVDPSGEEPITLLIIGGAALIGGGMNLWSNWRKVDGDWKKGVAYFASGAVGGGVSVVNPWLGGSITAGGNVVIDAVTGNLPDVSDGWETTKYVGGVLLDGLSAGTAGKLSEGLVHLGRAGYAWLVGSAPQTYQMALQTTGPMA